MEQDDATTGGGDRITLISDPGRTSYLVRDLIDGLREEWGEQHEITHRQTLLPLRPDGTLDVGTALGWARQDGAAMTVVVTELPRVGARGPKSTELHFAEDLAIISLPALGPVGVRHALHRELDWALTRLSRGSAEDAEAPHRGWRLQHDQGVGAVVTAPRSRVLARVRMTLGVVSTNEPLLALPKLSGAFAAASATGIFAVFSSGTWEMANALPTWRLLLVSVLGVLLLVGWLMMRNRLWDSPAAVGGLRSAVWYTSAAAVSVLISVVMLYLILFGGMLAVALLVIDPGYMAGIPRLDGRFANYLDIAWLAAAMGAVGGAIGSNFDEEADLENLVQGSRELTTYPRDAEQR